MKKHHPFRHIAIGLLLGIFLTVGGYSGTHYLPHSRPTPTPIPTASVDQESLTPIPSTGECDSTLWDHIYHPSRLQVLESCKTITGTVEVMRTEADGDFHILFKLDPAYSDLINQVNIDKQHGDLIIEPICENNVTQADAVSSCQGFSQNFQIQVGDHLQVTGAYVTDLQHGWREIHPISSIIKL